MKATDRLFLMALRRADLPFVLMPLSPEADYLAGRIPLALGDDAEESGDSVGIALWLEGCWRGILPELSALYPAGEPVVLGFGEMEGNGIQIPA